MTHITDEFLHAHAVEHAGDVSVMLHHASDCHAELQLLADNTRPRSALHYALAHLASIGRQTEIAINRQNENPVHPLPRITHAPSTR